MVTVTKQRITDSKIFEWHAINQRVSRSNSAVTKLKLVVCPQVDTRRSSCEAEVQSDPREKKKPNLCLLLECDSFVWYFVLMATCVCVRRTSHWVHRPPSKHNVFRFYLLWFLFFSLDFVCVRVSTEGTDRYRNRTRGSGIDWPWAVMRSEIQGMYILKTIRVADSTKTFPTAWCACPFPPPMFVCSVRPPSPRSFIPSVLIPPFRLPSFLPPTSSYPYYACSFVPSSSPFRAFILAVLASSPVRSFSTGCLSTWFWGLKRYTKVSSVSFAVVARCPSLLRSSCYTRIHVCVSA